MSKKTPENSASPSLRKKASQTSVWIIVGLVIIGLLGFGSGGLSGFVQTIGTVGDKDITTQSYFDALQAQMRSFRQQTGQDITFPQAQSLGLEREALRQLVAQRALEYEAGQQGLSIGDALLHEQLTQQPAFTALSGEFDQAIYENALKQRGITAKDYEISLQEAAGRELLITAVLQGTQIPPQSIELIIKHYTQQRMITWARVSQSALISPTPTPDESDLKTYYNDHIDEFTLPQRKRIAYAWLTPDMLANDIVIADADIEREYANIKDQFEQPEQRLVERLVFPTQDDAISAKKRLDSDAATFEDIVLERDLTLYDIDLGAVGRTDLSVGASQDVFAASKGDIIGPVQSSLGPALFRVYDIFPAISTPRADAYAQIKSDLAIQAAIKDINLMRDDIDDLLAGGADIKELAQNNMRVDEILWDAGSNDGIAAYQAFNTVADGLSVDDFPQILNLDSASVFAVELIETLPAQQQPFADVRADVKDAWHEQMRTKQLEDLAKSLADQVKQGVDMAAIGLNDVTQSELIRLNLTEGISPQVHERIFAPLSKGDVVVVNDNGSFIIARLDDIYPAAEDNPYIPQIRQSLDYDMNATFANDLLALFGQDIQARTDVNLNQQAINAVHAQMQ